MPTYRLVESSSGGSALFSAFRMCFLNVLRLHVSQNQRQKRMYKQYVEQLAGAYVERCADMDVHFWDRYRQGVQDWRYSLAGEESWGDSEGSRSCCRSERSDSGRCSSPCCSEVIFNGGQHFSGKGNQFPHVCRKYAICYPGNFGVSLVHV